MKTLGLDSDEDGGLLLSRSAARRDKRTILAVVSGDLAKSRFILLT